MALPETMSLTTIAHAQRGFSGKAKKECDSRRHIVWGIYPDNCSESHSTFPCPIFLREKILSLPRLRNITSAISPPSYSRKSQIHSCRRHICCGFSYFTSLIPLCLSELMSRPSWPSAKEGNVSIIWGYDAICWIFGPFCCAFYIMNYHTRSGFDKLTFLLDLLLDTWILV